MSHYLEMENGKIPNEPPGRIDSVSIPGGEVTEGQYTWALDRGAYATGMVVDFDGDLLVKVESDGGVVLAIEGDGGA